MFDIEKKLAHMALGDVMDIKDNDHADDSNHAGDYKILVKGFGSRIMNNGLLGAMAFLASKNKEHHQALFRGISRALKEIEDSLPWNPEEDNIKKLYSDVLAYLSKPENITQYMHIQQLSLMYIAHLRRYVSAFIEKEGGEQE